MPSATCRLIVSSDAATRLAAASDWLRAHPPDRELLIVGPSWEACHDLARTTAVESGARFGLARSTLDRLAGRLAAPALARSRRVHASALSLAAVVARAVHRLLADGSLSYFEPVAMRPGFSPAVARTLEELRMNAVDPRILTGRSGGGEDLAKLAVCVNNELEETGLADRASVFEAATAAARDDKAVFPVGLPLLLLDLSIAALRETKFLAALADRAPEVLATAIAGDRATIVRLEHALGCESEGAVQATDSTSLGVLKRHIFQDEEPPPGTLDATVTLGSAPGEARECVEIARRIQAEAARGVAFDRMAVLLHAPGEYTAHLEEALGRAEIPSFFARGVRRPNPAGRALLALLACAAERLSARRFAEYLSLAEVPDRAPVASGPERPWSPPDDDLLPTPEPTPGEESEAGGEGDATRPDPEEAAVLAGSLRAPWRWERVLVDAAVIGGKERWARRLAGLEEEVRLQRRRIDDADEARIAAAERNLLDLAHLRQFALPLIDRLAALPGRDTWEVWLNHLRELATAALRHPERVLGTLAELEPMAPVGPVDLDEVRMVLGPRLRDLTTRPPRRRGGAVFVGSTASARGLSFDVVLVPGLAERIFPRRIVEDPILSDAIRVELEHADLATQEVRVGAERVALRLAIGAARERVYLSYPRLDAEKARARVPSFYALEAFRAAEGELPGFEELSERAEQVSSTRLGWPAPRRPEEAIDEAEYDLALLTVLMEADAEAAAGSVRYLLTANPNLARALRTRGRRWLTAWTVADGLVKPDELALAALSRHQMSARSFSPTALQCFATCPYRFFLQAVHRLRPREEPVAIETIDPLTRGALIHDVQFGVLTRLRAEGLLPVRPATLDTAREILDGVLDEVVLQYEDRLAPAIKRVWDDGISAIRADLREWLHRQTLAEDDWVPYRFEFSFGLARAEHDRPHADPQSVADPVPVVGDLRLRGSIDLVERRPDGTLRVTDHKTGKVWGREGAVVGGGEILQPILYALACEQLLAGPVESGRLYYCTATGDYTERVVPLDEVSREAAKRVVRIIDRALRDGFLPAAPRDKACEHCDYLSVCGPHEKQRVKRKPRGALANLTALREMP